MTWDFWSSCLCLPSTRIADLYYHTRFIWSWGPSCRLCVHARQVLTSWATYPASCYSVLWQFITWKKDMTYICISHFKITLNWVHNTCYFWNCSCDITSLGNCDLVAFLLLEFCISLLMHMLVGKFVVNSRCSCIKFFALICKKIFIFFFSVLPYFASKGGSILWYFEVVCFYVHIWIW